MTRVRVKICGITRTEDAALAARLGADAVGLNFWPRSKRCVDVEAARAMVRALPPFVAAVGVFVNQPYDEVMRIAERARLTAVQLHGDEEPELCARFPLPVVKAIRVEGPASLAALSRYDVAAFLLDAPSAGFGGSGAAFDWSLARGAALGRPLLLAGGLTPENVGRAVAEVRPYAVDVASGVESAPGVKDPERMRRFIEAARAAEETT
jgi:phosphoribosylanthranilate isomerase